MAVNGKSNSIYERWMNATIINEKKNCRNELLIY
jgi:hypothetical protein